MNLKIHNQTKINITNIKKTLVSLFKSLKEKNNIHIIFIDNDKMQEMNWYYLRRKYPTDVLSFIDEMNNDSLGDIFISLPKAFEQAKEYNHSSEQEVSFLALHGYLHLKGFNDQTEESLQEMMNIQHQILEKNNLDFPY
ncbi:rRNA maturation RNase YbeY [Candidatus Phytoplasma melaleucae]|uniref:Endoribonuclease YbeY n=1 Tax=Candidatus Phytoplasma melaleucae TaxID=2982630 RepID=A0ABT9DDU5_9MOLU|nr:rRNA maturation RNase YbeY ['Melaleuca sp.' phytoplasma]MDO8168196.1 rRNA maturation RNase YbeY ['Melaleuca sp.' phytoplasma]MDV3205292.1 rRNA maturation RNase YbeY [Weeping tea tree witches'-broom phytoplasma]